jgi:hypothetical protein
MTGMWVHMVCTVIEKKPENKKEKGINVKGENSIRGGKAKGENTPTRTVVCWCIKYRMLQLGNLKKNSQMGKKRVSFGLSKTLRRRHI